VAVRVRQNGRIFCAARHPEETGDIYLDDGLHYQLSVELGLLVTETMDGGHRDHGEWWWRGLAPSGIEIDPFYENHAASGLDAMRAIYEA